MRNPRFLLFLFAVMAFLCVVARADAPQAMPLVTKSAYTCIPAPSGDPVRHKGRTLRGAQFVSELA